MNVVGRDHRVGSSRWRPAAHLRALRPAINLRQISASQVLLNTRHVLLATRDPATIRGHLKAIKAVLDDQPRSRCWSKPAEVGRSRWRTQSRPGMSTATDGSR